MNYNLLKTLAIWLAILWTANLNAQSGAWTLGLNGGAAYQQSDVCALPGGGFGLTLGKNIYHRPNGWLDVDVRGRYLYTHTQGANHFKTGDISKNLLLNGTTGEIPSYVAAPGYVFQNHTTDIHEGSGELVLTANKLRQNTGIEIGVFGGLGIDFHQSRTDQESSFGPEENYDYANIDTDGSRSYILNQLDAMQSGYASNQADGYANGFKTSIMPSAGIELGYAVTPWFSVGAGHRTTWALNDYLDGEAHNQLDNAVFNNDAYHYTNLYLRWKIKGKKTDEVIYNETVETLDPTEEPTTYSGPPPVIRIVRPNTNPAMVTTKNIELIAHVKNVKDKRNINVTHDGRDIAFNFEKSTGKLVSKVYLNEGKNIVEVYASNEFGRDEKGKTIIYEVKDVPTTSTPVTPTTGSYEPPVTAGKPPYVDIYSPSVSPYETTSTRVRIRAKVQNVDRKDQILFMLNNQYFKAFSYNPTTDLFEASVNMTVQQINVQIKAINKVGEASDFATLILKGTPEPNGPMCDPTGGSTGEPSGTPPTVKITNPSVNPYSTTKSTTTITARVREVTRKSDVTFTVNGIRNTNFSFNSSTGMFSSSITLNKGNNTVSILGRNNYGTDRDAVTIKYSTPVSIKPTVKITTPRSNPYTSTSVSTPLKATVTGVNSKSEIKITVNNNPIRNFTYSGNVVSTTVNLIEGNNNVVVYASNSNGSDSDSRTIKYGKPIAPPTVTIKTPRAKTATYTTRKAEVVAAITNITSSRDIRYIVGGRQSTNFTFSPKSGILKSTVTLGNNPVKVEIIATNKAGSDRDDRVLKYKMEIEAPSVKPPTVNIYKPERDIAVSNTTYEVHATVTGVTNKRQISVRNNSVNLPVFTFDPARKVVKVNVRLNAKNNVVITVGNEVGRASDNVNISRRTKVTIGGGGGTSTNPDPADPPTTGGGTGSWPTTGGGTTTNPDPADPPTTGGGSWPTTGGGGTIPKPSSPRPKAGKSGTVKSGTKQPTAKPVVRITTPGNLSYHSSSSVNISGTAKYVDAGRAFKITVNGRQATSVKFDANTGLFNATLNLTNGKNRIVVTGTNALGNGKKTMTLYHSRERTKPVIFGMGNSSQTVRKSQKTVKAIVANVSDKSSISVLVNGAPVRNFSYNNRSKLMTADVPLRSGTNKVEVQVRTRTGQASQVWTYTKR